MLSIQELENLDAEKYKETPEVLIDLSEELIFNKKYEKAIELREKAIKFSIEKNGDEKHVKCAPFYVHYADALIIKIMETQDLFNNPVDQEDKIQEEAEEEKLEKPKNGFNNIDPNYKGETKVEKENGVSETKEKLEDDVEIADEDNNHEEKASEAAPEEDPSQEDLQDEDIAADNLAFAESIYLENLKDHLNPSENGSAEAETITNPEEADKSLLFGLAEVYLKMGELETCKSDFQMAVEKYQKALEIRKKHDNKFSRAIAEIYFNMAKVYDFDAKKCLTCFVKARLIMEYHMKQKLIEAGNAELAEKIEIDESLLDKEEIDFKSVKTKNELYYANDQFVEGTLASNILDLGEIIKELDIKIEDVVIDIDTFQKLTQETQKVEEPQVQTNFTQNYDETKLVDVKAMGLVKKRDRKDLEKPVFPNGQQENQSENIQGNAQSTNKDDVIGEKVFKREGFIEKIAPGEDK